MTQPGARPQPAPLDLGATVRVLMVGVQSSGDLVPERIAGAVVEVQKVATPAELPQGTDLSAFDTVVAEASLVPALAPFKGAGSPPVLVGVGQAGAAGEWSPQVWVPAGSDDLPRAIEVAVSSRRLESARAEITRLREALFFARKTAHDLAQPLTTVMARSQLLLSKTEEGHPHYHALAIITHEAERLAESVEQFQSLKEMASLPPHQEES